jgi:hypothetical protein
MIIGAFIIGVLIIAIPSVMGLIEDQDGYLD